MLNYHINSSPPSAATVHPIQCQAITQGNADLLSTGPLGASFSEIQIKIQNIDENEFENVVLGKMS